MYLLCGKWLVCVRWPSTTKLWTKLIDFLFPLVIYIRYKNVFHMTRIQQEYILYKLDISVKPCGAHFTLFSLVDQKSYEIHYSWVASTTPPPPPCAFEEESMFFWEILLILGWWWPYYYTKVTIDDKSPNEQRSFQEIHYQAT
jgi:hypothetical protein